MENVPISELVNGSVPAAAPQVERGQPDWNFILDFLTKNFEKNLRNGTLPDTSKMVMVRLTKEGILKEIEEEI